MSPKLISYKLCNFLYLKQMDFKSCNISFAAEYLKESSSGFGSRDI